jgi:hypothetical protein
VKRSTILAAVLGLTVALLSGCKKDLQNNDAVKQGIMTYLAKRSDLLAMDVSVQSVAFHEDQATATVRFQAKGTSSPTAGMTMEYALERKGSQWVVKGRAGGTGDNPHTGLPQGAPGAPALPGAGGGGSIGAMPQTLPPGHPSVGSGGAPAGSLPAGHPPISSDKKPGESK